MRHDRELLPEESLMWVFLGQWTPAECQRLISVLGMLAHRAKAKDDIKGLGNLVWAVKRVERAMIARNGG